MLSQEQETASEEPKAEIAECNVASVSGGDTSAEWNMAETCIAQGDHQAALKLIERLATSDHGPAQLQLAKWLDPEELGPSPMDSRNPNTAIRLYAKARDAGLDEATPMLERLCGNLEGIDDLNAQMSVKRYCKDE